MPITDFIHHYPRALFYDIPRVGAYVYDIPGTGRSFTTYPESSMSDDICVMLIFSVCSVLLCNNSINTQIFHQQQFLMCCCLPTPMPLASGGGGRGSPFFRSSPAGSVHKSNSGVTMWCVCG